MNTDNDVICYERKNYNYPLGGAFREVCYNEELTKLREEINDFLWGVKYLHSEYNKSIKLLLDFVNLINRLPKGKKTYIKSKLTNKDKIISSLLKSAIEDFDFEINCKMFFYFR